jgi:metal-responsive CopG/Arc/MetJ family transcriptional regulator
MATSNGYKKELYSLPVEIVDELVEFAKETKQKKSHVVAQALHEYIQKREEKKRIKDALSIIGAIKVDKPLPDIQEIKANRYDV